MQTTRAAEFIEENIKTIFAYALSRVSNRDDAEDLTNDIVLAILQSANKLKDPNAFYGYVWGIAANTYRKFMQRKSHFSFEEIDDTASDEIDFTEELFAQEDAIRLRREIALLSKEHRECTIAYYYDELSCAEIAKKLNISLEMVKYYLFKTRKILKEGICMEREFGEKSFRPAPFTFLTIFSGKFNQEYRNLFSRKLPGQILMSAYYTPMTIRELAIELGVASIYLEDEVAMLEKYNLITKTSTGKYQTNLVIFTDDFMKEFYRKAEKFSPSVLAEILASMRTKLDAVRRLNHTCENLSDIHLLWSLLWLIICQGNRNFGQRHPDLQETNQLYSGATGTNYGTSTEDSTDEYGCNACAGYAGIDDNYYASAADFNVLPAKNHYFAAGNLNQTLIKERIYKTVAGEIKPEFMILTEAEEQQLFELFSAESTILADLYEQLFTCACRIMHIHAPKSADEQIDRIIFQTLFFQTVGFLGNSAVKSGALPLPDFDGPAAMYIRENTEAAKAAVNQKVLNL